MKSFHKFIYEHIKNNEALVCATIIEQSGSAPRTAGAKMIVKSDSSIEGTIGGGLYEAKAIEYAQNLFAEYANVDTAEKAVENDKATQSNLENSIVHEQDGGRDNYKALIVNFDLRGSKFPTDMDMVCGGELRLLIEYIAASESNVLLYESAIKAENLGQAFAIITCLDAVASTQEKYMVSSTKSLCYFNHNDTTESNTSNIPQGVRVCAAKYKNHKAHCLNLGNNEYVMEGFNKPYNLHIFGAGHVACELAKITQFLNFATTVIDDRAEFSNAKRFPLVTSLVLESLEQKEVNSYFDGKIMDSNDGVIIVTRGHARDREVLMSALKTKVGYVGMIGSRSKRQTTFDFLLENGFTSDCFTRIHSPIGLVIGAETPQEIAISIAAELIQWRAGLWRKFD